MITPAHKLSNNIMHKTPLDSLCTRINHLAIIPDGDRRWAREQGLPDSYGHMTGFTQAALNLLPQLLALNINTITFWCNSLENLKRDQREVLNAMDAFTVVIKKMIPIAQSCETKIVHFGTKELVPEGTLNALHEAEKETFNNTKKFFNIGINYSGRHEILRIAQHLINEKIPPAKITHELITSYTDFGKQPYPQPDLILRLGRAKRFSGFTSWNTGFSEIYFVNEHFPAMTMEHVIHGLEFFNEQKRNFGK